MKSLPKKQPTSSPEPEKQPIIWLFGIDITEEGATAYCTSSRDHDVAWKLEFSGETTEIQCTCEFGRMVMAKNEPTIREIIKGYKDKDNNPMGCRHAILFAENLIARWQNA